MDEQFYAAWTLGVTGAMKSAAEVNNPRLGRVPAGAPSAGFALLLVLAMAQFMVVLDFNVACFNVWCASH